MSELNSDKNVNIPEDGELLSIAAFFNKVCGIKIYLHNIPETFVYPSAYFPTPEIDENDMTLSGGWSVLKTTYIAVFSDTRQKSYNIVQKFVKALMAKRKIIPELNPDGSETGRFLRLRNVRITPAKDGSGATEIAVSWVSRGGFDDEEFSKIKRTDFNVYVGE